MIVYSVNVHCGGGKVLLDELLSSEPFGAIEHLFLDSRYPYIPNPKHLNVKTYPATVFGKLKAQLDLRILSLKLSKNEEVLFFGNWPPLFNLKRRSIIFLQNCFLFSEVPTTSLTFKERIRTQLERLILKIFKKNFQEIWVQSDWMLELSKKNFPLKIVLKKPFLPKMPHPDGSIEKVIDVITVTGKSQHKNYFVFIEALRLLDTRLNKKIRIVAVVDTNGTSPTLPFKNINFVEVNSLSRQDLFVLFQKSKLAVVTSSYESFCLPLYEALHFKLPVLCLDAPYVKGIAGNIELYEENTAKSLFESLVSKI